MASHGSGAMTAATLRQEVLAFRLAELHQVAGRLGLKKTGRKGELQTRILAYLGELDPSSQAATAALGRSVPRAPRDQWRMEQAVKAVHEVYCRMMGEPATASAPASDQSAHSAVQLQAGGGAAGLSSGPAGATAAAAAVRGAFNMYGRIGSFDPPYAQQHAQPPAGAAQQAHQQWAGGLPAHEPAAAARRARAVRCICGSGAERGGMVRCTGRGCGVWQHADCLGLELRDPEAARGFRCERCRARLADPFWEATEDVLPPSALRSQQGRPPLLTEQGPQEVQSADRVFYLNHQQLDPAQRDPYNHRVQVGCLHVGDEVALRYHWPKHVDLRINSIPHRPYGRAQNAKMGINQRDDVACIGSMVVRGRNALAISTTDGGTWVLLLQLARRRSMDEVKRLMAPAESLDEAVGRVRRQVGGGGGGDSDDDLLISHQVVSLKDPMSGQRMEVPARFADASGLQAFDLDSFLSMAQRNRKWQDPTTLANSSVEQLRVDSYMQRVLLCLRGLPDVSDVEISAEGQWRPDGSSGEWLDISADPASVAASLAASRAAAAAAEPKSEAAAGGAGGTEPVVPHSDGESEDELQELRRAAAAVRRASSAALDALAGQKRKQAEPEVIDLLSDSDDDQPAARQQPQQPQQLQQAQAQQQQQPHAAAAVATLPGGSVPLRIRLPVRLRPTAASGTANSTQGAPPAVPTSAWPYLPAGAAPPMLVPPAPTEFFPPHSTSVPFGGFIPASQVLPAGQQLASAWGPAPVPAAAAAPGQLQQPAPQPAAAPQAGSGAELQQIGGQAGSQAAGVLAGLGSGGGLAGLSGNLDQLDDDDFLHALFDDM